MLAPYAKFYITLVGVAVTSSLALIPPTTPLWIVLTILSGLVTAALTYQVPNEPLPFDAAYLREVARREAAAPEDELRAEDKE